MANHFLNQTWVRVSTAMLIVAGVSVGAYRIVTQTHLQPHAIASPLPTEMRQITSYRSASCGCCGAWVKHMQAQGFQVQDNIVEDIEAIKREHRVPEDLASCHTALTNGYVIEGHIPATDVTRLILEKPDVIGIAVPGMPIGSPGMESGNIQEPYTVFTFDQAGQATPFAQHPS